MPLGAPSDILAQVAAIVHDRGAKFVLDSSGVGLSATLERVPVYLVKPSMGELEALKGRHGKTLSSMRPSGSVDFDGRRVDALTEGMMID